MNKTDYKLLSLTLIIFLFFQVVLIYYARITDYDEAVFLDVARNIQRSQLPLRSIGREGVLYFIHTPLYLYVVTASVDVIGGQSRIGSLGNCIFWYGKYYLNILDSTTNTNGRFWFCCWGIIGIEYIFCHLFLLLGNGCSYDVFHSLGNILVVQRMEPLILAIFWGWYRRCSRNYAKRIGSNFSRGGNIIRFCFWAKLARTHIIICLVCAANHHSDGNVGIMGGQP